MLVKAVQGSSQTRKPQGKAIDGSTQFRVTPSVSESYFRSIGHALEFIRKPRAELNANHLKSLYLGICLVRFFICGVFLFIWEFGGV